MKERTENEITSKEVYIRHTDLNNDFVAGVLRHAKETGTNPDS
ncbi:hypothetical protein [Butyrivibrio sp. AE3006]|nr:hypothetical protein [Butyrivibrio sp. AE3006]